uniref:Histone-lysine N-methyltransferase, H3 lysine-79 specific n=1 Tax=Haptolina ericina TaxID=156174 RepID=A0A7S3AM29_9EUKA|mmetsp:Transcript_24142/g.54930  ORF Transcript_24142/g.54930 Transcript_24142/m.54930 type:complete len:222 (+) Transcript_24142:17-682(+)
MAGNVAMAQLKKMQELGIESEFWAESSSDLVGADSSDERELRRRRRRYNDRLIAKAVRVATQQMQSRGDADDETDVRARAIDRLFDGIQPVHDIAESEMALINECGASTAADVYGELTVAGARDVLHSLDVHATETLYDLGSGAGRFVLQAAMEHPLLRCVGVELSQTRHDAATLAARRAALPNLTLVHADLLEAPLDDASHVFVASLVFRWTLDPAAAHI